MSTNIDESLFQARAKHRSRLRFRGGVLFALLLAIFGPTPAKAQFALGTTSIVVGPTVGSGSVVLAAPSTWNASSSDSWLTLTTVTGPGSQNVIFNYQANTVTDPNLGETRHATITFTCNGQTPPLLSLTVTQARYTYVQAPLQPTSVVPALYNPVGVAVDGSGNVYIADTGNNAVKVWIPGTGLITLVAGLNFPDGVAVDGSGNVYIADTGNNAIKEWIPGTGLITLPTSGLSNPHAVAVDGMGNVYIADTGNNRIVKLPKGGTATTMNITVQSPNGVAVDAAGDTVYIADSLGVWRSTSSISKFSLHTGGCGSVAVDSANNVYFIAGLSVEMLPLGGLNPISVAPVSTASGYNQGVGAVAVNAAGDTVYIADFQDNEIKKVTVATKAVTKLVSSPFEGNNGPLGIAVDGSGNVYAVNGFETELIEWTAANQTVATITPPAAGSFEGVTVDGSGNVYVSVSGTGAGSIWGSANGWSQLQNTFAAFFPAADAAGDLYLANYNNGNIYKWTQGFSNPSAGGANHPEGLAVDAAGNLYVGFDGGTDFEIDEFFPGTPNFIPLVPPGQVSHPHGIAVDGSGNVYIADNQIHEYSPANGLSPVYTGASTASTVYGVYSAAPGFWGVAVDGLGNVYFSDSAKNVVEEVPYAFVDTKTIPEICAAGWDSLPLVLPTTVNLLPPFAPTSDSAWLNIVGAASGVVTFVFAENDTPSMRTGHIILLGVSIPVQQSGNCSTSPSSVSLCTNTRLEGPNGGSDSVVFATASATTRWSGVPTAIWLHLNAANQYGTGSGTVVFNCDANPVGPRVGTILINGQTVTVTQAGLGYSKVTEPTVLGQAQGTIAGLAVDGSGNVFFVNSSTTPHTIQEWTLANNQVTVVLSSGLISPGGPAWDGGGNLYIPDAGEIKKWPLAGGAASTAVPSSSGLQNPVALAIDGPGNIYIADAGNNAIFEWPASLPQTLIKLSAYFDGDNYPNALASDCAGNLYYTTHSGYDYVLDLKNGGLPSMLPFQFGLYGPFIDLAADGAGNVYINGPVTPSTPESAGFGIGEWKAVSDTVTPLVSPTLGGIGTPPVRPYKEAVDGMGNLYFQNLSPGAAVGAIEELPYAFVDTTPIILPSCLDKTYNLPPVLPATVNLNPPFYPYVTYPSGTPLGDQGWLTIPSGGVTGNMITYHVTMYVLMTATGGNRTAYINVLGQQIAVTQQSCIGYSFRRRLERSASGRDSFVLAAASATNTWTATANDSWLHLAVTNGTGSMNVIFSYDPNPGPTRAGTLTLAGQTYTVTQAGSTYVQAPGPLTTLVSSTNQYPGVAVDAAGNVYIADPGNSAIEEWTAANNAVTTLVSSTNLSYPEGVAVDTAGNVFIADPGNNAIYEWIAASNTVTTLVSGLNGPSGVAVDGAGNVYIADYYNNAIEEWSVRSNTVTTLVSGLNGPSGVAVDGAGNVYIADTGDSAIYEWVAASSNLVTLVSSNLNTPQSVAVDAAGNVFIADPGNNAIYEWIAASNTVTTLASSGLGLAWGVAVGGWGDVYIADAGNNAIEELPYAFVDPTPRLDGFGPGSDVLPSVLPSTANLNPPFYPTTDQPWLTISGVADGVVSFAFTVTPTNRKAHITLLGQSISVTQVPPPSPTLMGATTLGSGVFQLSFSNTLAGATFTVLSTTNLSVPLTNWMVVSAATNTAPGLYQFTDTAATNAQRFYRVRSP